MPAIGGGGVVVMEILAEAPGRGLLIKKIELPQPAIGGGEIARTRGIEGIALVDREQHADFLAGLLDDISLLRVQLERDLGVAGPPVGAPEIRKRLGIGYWIVCLVPLRQLQCLGVIGDRLLLAPEIVG